MGIGRKKRLVAASKQSVLVFALLFVGGSEARCVALPLPLCCDEASQAETTRLEVL